MDPARKLSLWHPGEKELQSRIGVAEHMEALGKRIVRDYMPDQHRDFFASLPFVVMGTVDDAGDPWATLLAGEPGFLSSPEPRTLVIGARGDPTDPASSGMRDGHAAGFLGIELHTRRRNRVNGMLRDVDGALCLDVEQSFGNCPQYIQLRDARFARDPAAPFTGAVDERATLDDEARATILAADTFFVATYVDREGQRQVDVSHRGGKARFVRVAPDGTLTIPDFAGALFFATLGNILLNGKAGLVFPDYATGDLLQLTGDATVILDSPEIAAFQGAERLWSFRARRLVRRKGVLALRAPSQSEGASPNALLTGDWAETAERLRAAELATRWRPFTIARIVDESRSIRSLHLRPDDGAGIVPHAAGQHLPIRVAVPGVERPVIRTYTLSVAPSDGEYRISVKRDGLVSSFLHDLRVGDPIEARAPAGAFTIDAHAKRRAVLLAGGVGITPLLAMLRHVVYEAVRKRGSRPVTLFHAAHTKAERPFDRELAELAAVPAASVQIVRVLGDPTGAEPGVDYDATGRIDMALLARTLPFGAHDFYLCGPPAFVQSLYDGLRGLDVPDARIHAEAFGPSALVRTTDTPARSRPAPGTKPVPVVFLASGKEARWEPGAGSLLELAESRGLAPEFQCRGGACGTCRTKLRRGAVTYTNEPTAPHADDEVLLCCAVPTDQDGSLELDA